MERRDASGGLARVITPAESHGGLVRFLESVLDEPFVVEDFRRIPGGGSNATFRFALKRAGEVVQLILRVKQPGCVDTMITREFEMMQALYGELPIPRPYWYTEDPTYLGAPAMVLEFADGVQSPPGDNKKATGMGTQYGEGLRVTLGPQFVQYEARLHAFDWAGSTLDAFDIPRPGTTDAIDWRLAFWSKVWELDKFEEHPTMTLTEEWLWENRPIVDRVSALHGDFRNGNFLFDEVTGNITSILDWELCSLGDRHCDLGYTMLRAWGYEDDDGLFINSALMDTESFIKLYEATSGLRVDREKLFYYIVFNVWWSAVALLGTGLRNSDLGVTQLDVVYNVIAGKGVFDIGELNRTIVGV